MLIRPTAVVLSVLVAMAVAPAVGPAVASADPAPHDLSVSAAPSPKRAVASRSVVFKLVNTNDTSAFCLPDNKPHQVRARLVGPPRAVMGYSGVARMNVLVHDAGAGAWFFNLRGTPRNDYATQLARQGQISVVLDRLGYDSSPLRDGTDTCLGAQAHMLHQVVQHLYAGKYAATSGSGKVPVASRVVVHGHGTGALVAQLEAAEHDDVAGLVLMSLPSTGPTARALAATRAQATACARGRSHAAFGPTPAAYRRLMFSRATPAVRRAATRLRNPTPCGEVTSLAATLFSSALSARQVEAPVLLLSGARDRRAPVRSRSQAKALFPGSRLVTARTIAGAGSALPLERSAATTRRVVGTWLSTVPPTRN